MRRRSKASGEPAKSRPGKAAALKQRNAPKSGFRRIPPVRQETEVVRLARELRETQEQQAATADVLKVISRSAFDLPTVLNTLVESAARICDADHTWLFRRDGEYRWAASYGHSTEEHDQIKQYMLAWAVSPGRGSAIARTLLEGRPVQIADVAAYPDYDLHDVRRIANYRTALGIPLLREGVPIGVLALTRSQPRIFTDKQIELLITFADQAVIAIENTRLLNELRESLQHQTATADVLRIISSSPGELEPVFQTMLENATRICQAELGMLWLADGDGFRPAALHGVPPDLAGMRQREKVFHFDPEVPLGRLAQTKQLDHIVDAKREPAYVKGLEPFKEFVDVFGARTFLLVPMLQDDTLVGVIAIYRKEVRPFTDKQIALVQNFAAQAVIAIENTRLLNELRQRTAELTDSLEQQTATSDVLSVISSSPGEMETVFRSMLENAVRICQAKFGFMLHYDGDTYNAVAELCDVPAYVEEMRRGPLRPHPESALGCVARTRQVAQIADITAHRLYAEHNPLLVTGAELGGIRTIVAVPMVKDQQLIGAITIFRQEVRPFTDKQIALVQNFAAQAVIAIENARLLNELRQRTDDLTESLDQRTATSEVLRVISSSPGELAAVFHAILENATRICEANYGTLYLFDDNVYRLAASVGTPLEFDEFQRKRGPFAPTPGTHLDHVMRTKRVKHAVDETTEPVPWHFSKVRLSIDGERTHAQGRRVDRRYPHLSSGGPPLH